MTEYSKKIIALCVSVIMTLGALAQTAKVGGIYYTFDKKSRHATVTQEKLRAGYKGNIVIPESVTYQGAKYQVTAIDESAFCGNNLLLSVKIPNTVVEIGANAFLSCEKLVSITIPKSVTSITDNPLSGCVKLTKIVVEQGNSVYDSRENCNAIIRTSDNELISGCSKTVLPETVTAIGKEAFSGISMLTALTIPNSVKHIAEYAFSETGLTTLTIPESVTTISEGLFFECKQLKTVTLPETLTKIDNVAFKGCSSLTAITIPCNVTNFGTMIFESCPRLSTITNHGKTPPTFAFNQSHPITLFVRKGCKSQYPSEDWSNFTIKEIE